MIKRATTFQHFRLINLVYKHFSTVFFSQQYPSFYYTFHRIHTLETFQHFLTWLWLLLEASQGKLQEVVMEGVYWRQSVVYLMVSWRSRLVMCIGMLTDMLIYLLIWVLLINLVWLSMSRPLGSWCSF